MINQGAQREMMIVTPEQVRLRFESAGLGSRAAAQIIDSLVLGLVNLLIMIAALTAIGWGSFNQIGELEGYAIALAIAFMFLINFGYYMVLEYVWHGRTIGKKMLHLRVLQDNGQPLTFLSAAIRNLFRIFDMLPYAYMAAAVTSFLHPQDKRLGDLVAGTIVVYETGSERNSVRRRVNKTLQKWQQLPLVTVEDWQANRLEFDDWRLLAVYIERLPHLTVENRLQLGSEVVQQLTTKLGMEEAVQPYLASPAELAVALYVQLRDRFEL
ncbi:RDD family protein [Paenibacillus sp. y28]|uniref:RDD family protein n=1 Tax=Paenibacillus sp. y28 TaxID=3129110 RepID=UPI003015930F